MLIQKVRDEVRREHKDNGKIDEFAGIIKTQAHSIGAESFTTSSVYRLLLECGAIRTRVEDIIYNYHNDGEPRKTPYQGHDGKAINYITHWLDTGNLKIKVNDTVFPFRNIEVGLHYDRAYEQFSKLIDPGYAGTLVQELADEYSNAGNRFNVFYRYLGFSYSLMMLDCVYIRGTYPKGWRWNKVSDTVYLYIGTGIEFVNADSGLRQNLEALC